MAGNNKGAGGPDRPNYLSSPLSPADANDRDGDGGGGGSSSVDEGVNAGVNGSIPDSTGDGIDVNEAGNGIDSSVNGSVPRGARSLAGVAGHFVVRRGPRLLLNGKPFVSNGWNTYWLMYEAAIPQERYLVSNERYLVSAVCGMRPVSNER